MYEKISYILAQLAQRGIGVGLCHFYHLELKVGKLYYEIPAYNQLLYIELYKLMNGTRIIADNTAFELTPPIYKAELVQEFTGLVTIEFPYSPNSEDMIEFIQVVKS